MSAAAVFADTALRTFSFLEGLGFTAQASTDERWAAAHVVFHAGDRFVVVDVCRREGTLNVLLGELDEGALPAYPIALPATDEEPLRWIPLWALAETRGTPTTPPVIDGSVADLRAEMIGWVDLLREHAEDALAGRVAMPRLLVGDVRALATPLEGVSREGAQDTFVIGQSQGRRVASYARARGLSVFLPPVGKDDREFFDAAAKFMRGARARDVSIVDLGPDPLIKSDKGGYLYMLQRMLLEQVAGGPRNTYRRLRDMALSPATLRTAGLRAQHPDVVAAVIDLPQGDSEYVTLVAMADGTTSLYNTLGGGQIGAGAHREVADATRRLLGAIQGELGRFAEAGDTHHPPAGTVRIFATGNRNVRRADVSDDAFWCRIDDELSPVIVAAQAVITELGRVQPVD